MCRVAESLASSSETNPAIVEPCNSLFVKSSAAFATQPGFSDACLHSTERHKQHRRRQQPPYGQAAKHAPQQYQPDGQYRETHKTNFSETLKLPSAFRPAFIDAAHVFTARIVVRSHLGSDGVAYCHSTRMTRNISLRQSIITPMKCATVPYRTEQVQNLGGILLAS